MKLSRFAFARFWQVHAWAGVTTSLVVYVMFLLGAVTLFYEPLTHWEEPLLHRPQLAVDNLQSLLDLAGPLPQEFYLYLPDEQRTLPHVGYFAPGTTQWRSYWLDSEQQRVIARREGAAAHLYDLHFLWHDVTGYWLQYGAGVLVFGFLLALVTGTLIQLKNLRRQLNQVRVDRDARTLHSDLHKMIGVFGLPFQLMYALTGSLLVLSPLLFQLSIKPVFGGDVVRAAEVAGVLNEELPERAVGPRITPLPLDTLVAKALAREPLLVPESIAFRYYPYQIAAVDVRGHVRGQPFGDGFVRVRASDGEIELVQTPDSETRVGTVARWLHEAHTVQYGDGGLALRIMLALLALGGCVTILTGNWIWIARRPQTAANRFLARLTAGIGAGTPVAVAALLLASRVFPLPWPERDVAEQLVLAVTFAGCIAWALSQRDPTRVWWQLLTAAAVLLASVPAVAARASTAGLFGEGPRQSGVVGVEIAMLVVAATLLCLALGVRTLLLRAARARQPATAAA